MKLGYLDCIGNDEDNYANARKMFDGMVEGTVYERRTSPEIEKIPVIAKKMLKNNDIIFVVIDEMDDNKELIEKVKNKLIDIECELEKYILLCTSTESMPARLEMAALLAFSPGKFQERVGKK